MPPLLLVGSLTRAVRVTAVDRSPLIAILVKKQERMDGTNERTSRRHLPHGAAHELIPSERNRGALAIHFSCQTSPSKRESEPFLPLPAPHCDFSLFLACSCSSSLTCIVAVFFLYIRKNNVVCAPECCAPFCSSCELPKRADRFANVMGWFLPCRIYSGRARSRSAVRTR